MLHYPSRIHSAATLLGTTTTTGLYKVLRLLIHAEGQCGGCRLCLADPHTVSMWLFNGFTDVHLAVSVSKWDTVAVKPSARAWQSACESRRESGKTASDLENANSSPPLQRSVAWQRGRKKPHKASPTKLHFLSSPLLSSALASPLPPSLHSHTDPILSACLFVVRLIFCRLGEYFMLWCYIQQFRSAAPLIRKKARCFIIKRG